MKNVLRKIDIDLYSTTSYEVVKAQQGDKNSRIIEFALYNQGNPYELTDNISFRFVGHRGDGSSFSKNEEDCITRDGNKVDVTLLEDILYYDGIVEAKLVMYELSGKSERKVLSTIPFKISCIKNPCNENNLSEGEYSIVTDLIFQVEEFSKKAQDVVDQAKNSADIASTKATEASSSADKAKLSEENAKKSEANAESSKTEAAKSASAAKTSEDNSLGYAKQAQSYAVGTGDVRPDEGTDCAKYYYLESKDIYDNFMDKGIVTGVKGDAETSYRHNDVNITPENIGLGNVDNTADEDKRVAFATNANKDSDGNVIKDSYAVRKTLIGGSCDFNDATDPGLYNMVYVNENSPSENNDYFSMLVMESDSRSDNYIHQIAIKNRSTDIYIRYKNVNYWSKWEQIYTRTNLMDAIYPVGSIYMSVSSTNPSALFGGVWVRWGNGKVPVGISESETEFSYPEKTGGDKTVSLSLSNMPEHDHGNAGESFGFSCYALERAGMDNPKLFEARGSATVGGSGHIKRLKATANQEETGGSADTITMNTAHTHSKQGSGTAHNNLQPYITCYMWKRTA